MQISTYLYVSLSAMLAWQDTQPFYVKRWRPISPSSCSQVLDAIVTHKKIIRRTAWMHCDHENWIYQQENRIEKRKFLIHGFLRGCNQEGGVLNFAPFLLWEFKARSWPLQRPLSHLLKIKPPTSALKIQIWEPRCLHTMACIRVKNRSHLTSYLHNKHGSFKCLIWYSH